MLVNLSFINRIPQVNVAHALAGALYNHYSRWFHDFKRKNKSKSSSEALKLSMNEWLSHPGECEGGWDACVSHISEIKRACYTKDLRMPVHQQIRTRFQTDPQTGTGGSLRGARGWTQTPEIPITLRFQRKHNNFVVFWLSAYMSTAFRFPENGKNTKTGPCSSWDCFKHGWFN